MTARASAAPVIRGEGTVSLLIAIHVEMQHEIRILLHKRKMQAFVAFLRCDFLDA